MTTIHIQYVGDKALIPQNELDQLLQLARKSQTVVVQRQEEDWPIAGVMRLMEEGGSFDFWKDAGEDIYSATDGEPV